MLLSFNPCHPLVCANCPHYANTCTLPAYQGGKFPPGLRGLLGVPGLCLIPRTLHSSTCPLPRCKEILCPGWGPCKGSLLAALSWVPFFSWWSRPLSSPGVSYFCSYLSSVSERILFRPASWVYRVKDVHVEPFFSPTQ